MNFSRASFLDTPNGTTRGDMSLDLATRPPKVSDQ